jgi:hypothetical protein
VNGPNDPKRPKWMQNTAQQPTIGLMLQSIVTKIIAGTNITISPTSGTGAVTISASGGGGGGGVTQIVAGTGISVSPSGGTGVVTVTSTGGGVSYNIDGAIAALPGIRNHWKLNDAAGTTMPVDSIGGSTALTTAGAVTPVFGAPSITGDGETCVFFNGISTSGGQTTSLLEFTSTFIPTTGDFSIGFVLSPVQDGRALQGIFCQDVNNALVMHLDTTANINLGSGSSQGGANRYHYPVKPYLYVLSVSRSTSVVSLYVQGVLYIQYTTLPAAQASVGAFGYRFDNGWGLLAYAAKFFLCTQALTQANVWTLKAQLPQ